MPGHRKWILLKSRKAVATPFPKHATRVAAVHQEMQEEVRLLLNLEQPLARPADAPDAWASDVRDLVGLVLSLSSDLVAAEDELSGLRRDLASHHDSP